jgi:pimeloyl-ACP methyl ester carboxylesterase/DNA-binding CsgD family transcriptional regulator
MNQQIRFCRSFDGTRIAYAIVGEGPPLVRAPGWLTHLEHEWDSPLWRPWIDALSAHYTYLRMDQRACGLSDRGVADISFDAWVRDLEAVIDAAGFEQFTLFGTSQGGAIAIPYAVRHPERVTRLVLLGAYACGALKRDPTPDRVEELRAQLKLVASGWGREDPAYRHLFSSQFVPGATLEQLNSLSELQRVSTTPEDAARIIETTFTIDVRELAPQVRCPTLLVHARGDRRAPFEEGRILASLIPDARLVPLDTSNHILLESEPAFHAFLEELRAFVPVAERTGAGAQFGDLTPREAEVLEHIARGLDNAQIAAHLDMSEKTVRNHITRILDKIAVENRSQAIVLARRHGLGTQSRRS